MNDEIAVSKAEQVARTLEQEIRQGVIPRGDRLASEADLMQRFAVSRNTVRKGLEALARRGLITTRTGIGSFVAYDGRQINDAMGWSQALAQGTGAVRTNLLDLRRGPCPSVAARIDVRDDFLCLDRLRLWQAVPDASGADEVAIGISLERSRLPWRPGFAEILRGGLQAGSLSQSLRNLGIVAHSGQEWAGVLPGLSASDAGLMGRRAGEPMLHLRRVTRDASGGVIEHVESLLDPARFTLSLEF